VVNKQQGRSGRAARRGGSGGAARRLLSATRGARLPVVTRRAAYLAGGMSRTGTDHPGPLHGAQHGVYTRGGTAASVLVVLGRCDERGILLGSYPCRKGVPEMCELCTCPSGARGRHERGTGGSEPPKRYTYPRPNRPADAGHAMHEPLPVTNAAARRTRRAMRLFLGALAVVGWSLAGSLPGCVER
jgi:hypothetical protein